LIGLLAPATTTTPINFGVLAVGSQCAELDNNPFIENFILTEKAFLCLEISNRIALLQ
jgi:hypothetical protein